MDKQEALNGVRDRILSTLKRESEAMDSPSSRGAASRKVQISKSHLNDVAWFPLSDTKVDPTGQTPSHLEFPSGEEILINSWADSISEVANWLIRKGKLSREDCPVSLGRAKKRCIINATPHHLDGTTFDQKRDLLDDMYIHTHYRSSHMISNTRNLLRKFGEDPSQFHIKIQQNKSTYLHKYSPTPIPDEWS